MTSTVSSLLGNAGASSPREHTTVNNNKNNDSQQTNQQQQQKEGDGGEEEEHDAVAQARFPAVLEPTGRSALELHGEKLREAEVMLTLQVRTWPEWRQTVSRFVRFDPWFERVVFGLIVLNALTILGDSIVEGTNAPSDPLKGLRVAVDIMDDIVTWAFFIEMVFKLVAVGIWTEGCGYFASVGNWIDFLINVFSIYASIRAAVSTDTLGNAASAVRSVRLLRTFRAVKALRHLRLLVDALFVALGRLADVGLLYLIFIAFMVFIGLQLFQGRFSRNCVMPVGNSSSLVDANGTVDKSVVHTSWGPNNETIFWISTLQICDEGMPQAVAERIAGLPADTNYTFSEPFGDVNHLFTGYICPYGQWCKGNLAAPERDLIGFEDIYFALMSLTTVSVFENWSVVMYSGMFARGYAASWYFLAVAFVGTIFVLNLVLAILTDAFTQSLTILRKDSGDDEDDNSNNNNKNNSADGAPKEIGSTAAASAAATRDDNDSGSSSRRRGSGGSQPTLLQRALTTSPLAGNRAGRAQAVADMAHRRGSNSSFGRGRAASHDGDDDDDPDAYRDFDAERQQEQSAARRRRYDAHSRVGFLCDDNDPRLAGLVPPGGRMPHRRVRSYTLVSELRKKINVTQRNFSLDATVAASSEELDESLDWFSDEWAQIVLAAAKNEDMETMAASELSEHAYTNDGSCSDTLSGRYRRFQSWVLQNIVVAPAFARAGFILTTLNIILLSIVFPKMDSGLKATLSVFSVVLSMTFVVESIVRFVGLGWRMFARDPFNIIDGMLALVSLIELGTSGSSVISAVRTVRLMRMLSYFPSVVATLRTLAAGARASASLLVQMFIMIFVMAVLGQQLFRGQLCNLAQDPPFLGVTPSKLCPGVNNLSPVYNFDSLASSVLTVFVVVAGDGWRQFWTECSYRTTRYHSLYFIAIYILGNVLLCNLFVAVLIDAANQSSAAGEEEEQKQIEEQSNDNGQNQLQSVATTETPKSSSTSGNALDAPLDQSNNSNKNKNNSNHSDSDEQRLNPNNNNDDDDSHNNNSRRNNENEPVDIDAIPESELWWLAKMHRRHVPHHVRVFCARIVLSRVFSAIVAVTSFAASISYFFWADAKTYPDSPYAVALDVLELVAAAALSLDSLLRWIALGHATSYLALFINVVSYFTLIFQVSSFPHRATVIAVSRIATRALRPWIYALQYARFRLVFYSLTRAVSALRSVGVISILMWFTYGVLGAQLFNGKLSACTEGRLEFDWGDQTYLNSRIQNETECLANNYTWLPFKYNYDNVGASMLSLVTAATTDDWSNLMYLTTGAEGDGIAPQPGKYLSASFFMCSFVILFAWFLINVITSVLVDAYFTTKKQMEDGAAKLSDAKMRERKLAELAHVVPDAHAAGGRTSSAPAAAARKMNFAAELEVLDDNQTDYYDLCIHALLLVKPTMPVFFTEKSWRWRVRSVIRSRWFNYIYLAITVLDFVMQTTQFFSDLDSPSGQLLSGWALLQCDIVLSSVLLAMTACRIAGNSWSGFLLESSNILEGVVNLTVFASNIIEVIVFAAYDAQQLNSHASSGKTAAIDKSFVRFQQFHIAGVILGVVRNVRMFRFQRVLNTFHGVRVIIFTVRTSLRNFAGGLALVFLVYYFFAALGLAMFGRIIENGSGLTRNNNFATLPSAMHTLVRVGTTDDWEAVMRSASLDIYPCESELGNCGTPWLGVPYFYLFILFGQWITMSSFVAILLDSFSDADRSERFAVQKADVDRFRKLWKMLCDNKTQLLSVAKLPMFLQRLGPALSIEEKGYVASLPVAQESLKRVLRRRIDEVAQEMAAKRAAAGLDAEQSPLPDTAVAGDGAADENPDDEFDDAGEEFARAVILKKTVDRTSLATRFCSLRRAQDYVAELRVSSRESDSFTGVVTQRQVFEACIKHHYHVPLPASYEQTLNQQFELTFPLDVFRLAEAATGNTTMFKNDMLPNGQLMTFDMQNTTHLLQLIRLQAWWRGLRFRRVIQAALKKSRDSGATKSDMLVEIESVISKSRRPSAAPTSPSVMSSSSSSSSPSSASLLSGGSGGGAGAGGKDKNAKPKRKTKLDATPNQQDLSPRAAPSAAATA